MSNPFFSKLETAIQEDIIFKSKFPDILEWGKWVGMQCQNGFYTFYYREEDQTNYLITEDASENTYKLRIPFDHRLNLISFARTHIDSEALDIRYIPVKTDDTYYDLIYQNATLTARSVIWEGGDAWENLGGAEIHFVITGTNTKKWKPRVNIQFLEIPS